MVTVNKDDKRERALTIVKDRHKGNILYGYFCFIACHIIGIFAQMGMAVTSYKLNELSIPLIIFTVVLVTLYSFGLCINIIFIYDNIRTVKINERAFKLVQEYTKKRAYVKNSAILDGDYERIDERAFYFEKEMEFKGERKDVVEVASNMFRDYLIILGNLSK